MRKAMLASLMLAGSMALTGCASQQMPPLQTPQTQPAPLRIEVTGGREQTLLPGAALEGEPAVRNAGSMDVYCFLKVEMPVFAPGTVSLEADEPVADPVPLIRTAVSDDWALVTESESGGIRTSVYAYGAPSRLQPGETTPELFTEWRVTNFRVRGGVCGDYAYEDLMANAALMQINGYAIQADHIGTDLTAETLWSMIN